ncbi:Cytochrome B561-related [Trypanosoma melophagium]|uniref:Cytochrome B561-related n=1 Tax=Trypanosoma melophagium TaxID=715481 RepID=UPI003519D974|nr:Cytochrome B561-related [Trypanosoma melophagium]
MRLSYGDQLIELDQQRRARVYGRGAKRLHLKVLATTSALMYVVTRFVAWMYPKSVTHAWVDDVFVEVVEDDALESVCVILRWIFLWSMFLLVLLTFKKGKRQTLPPRRDARVGVNEFRRAKGWAAPFSAIAVPAATVLGGLPRVPAPITSAVVEAQEQRQEQRQQQPIRSEAELDEFLMSTKLESEKETEVTVKTSAPTGTTFTTAGFSAPLVGGGITVGPSDGIRVQYSNGVDQPPASQPVDTEWAGLGILNAERSLLKVRKWLSDVCQELAEEIAACDRWFAEHRISSFDSRHSLQETISLPQTPPAAGVGFALPTIAPNGTAATVTLRKLEALVNERKKLTGQAQNVQNFDTISHLDQRLGLEAKLDLGSTFPLTSSFSVAELQARRQYIIKRIRTFASQKTLASYKHNRGDVDTWRDEFPSDAHLLIHIVRVSVDGFANYVKFPHQPMNQQQDLALFIGDTGEPYFYVRYRSGPVDKTYATHKGIVSLFEALLIFVAIVRTYHNASYGGIWGVMDLSRTGLLGVL